MPAISKAVLILVALYVGGVAGFLGGYLANATILRSYRDEADELRVQLYSAVAHPLIPIFVLLHPQRESTFTLPVTEMARADVTCRRAFLDESS